MVLKINIYQSEICGSYYQLRENLNQALAELQITAEIAYIMKKQ